MRRPASVLSPLFVVSLSATLAAQERSAEPDPNRGLGGTRVGFDVDYANGIGEVGVDSGFGGALRVGHEYDALLLSLTPELMGSIHKFSGPADSLDFAGLVGGRLTIGKFVEPGVFAHVGAGHVSLPGDNLTGLALDLGLTLDFTLLPAIDLGVHAAYDRLAWGSRDSFDWYRLGAHLVFAP